MQEKGIQYVSLEFTFFFPEKLKSKGLLKEYAAK